MLPAVIIADASIWRAALDPSMRDIGARVADLWTQRVLTAPAAVFAQVLAESENAHDVGQIRNWALSVPPLNTNPLAWLATGDLAARLRAQGDILNLLDVFVLAVAVREGCPLWTQNRAVLSALNQLPIKAYDPGTPR